MLPKQLFVWEEREGKDNWLMASKTPPEEHGVKVGIYTLKEIKTIKVETKLV